MCEEKSSVSVRIMGKSCYGLVVSPARNAPTLCEHSPACLPARDRERQSARRQSFGQSNQAQKWKVVKLGPETEFVHLFYGSCERESERVSVKEGLRCDFLFICREDERFPIDDLQPLYRASAQRYDEAARQGDEHSGNAHQTNCISSRHLNGSAFNRPIKDFPLRSASIDTP